MDTHVVNTIEEILIIGLFFVFFFFSWRKTMSKAEIFSAKVLACKRTILRDVDYADEFPAIEISLEIYKEVPVPFTYSTSWAEDKPMPQVGHMVKIKFFAGLPQEITDY